MNYFLMMNRWIMTKHNLIVILTAVVLSLFICLNAYDKKATAGSSVKALVFHTTNGWGYDILVNDSVFIHQVRIPVVNGNWGFEKKEEAEKTAQLIINKIKKGQYPILTIFELEKIIPVNKYQHGK